MTTASDRLRPVPLFAGLSDDDLERICREVEDRDLQAGEVLFEEGDPGDCAYVITAGEIEILKATERREVLLAVRREGEVIGEMALLHEEPRSAGARARTRATLATIPKSALDELLDVSPHAARAIFDSFVQRLRATNDQLRQGERMTQLGTLTAGVAHELNNPSAAVARGAERLAEQVDGLTDLLASATPEAATARARAIELATSDHEPPRDALARSDLEDELAAWLTTHGVVDARPLATGLADQGVGAADLASLADLRPEQLRDGLEVAVRSATLRRTAAQLAEAAGRISAIVRSLKSYAYLDQTPVQDVDVVRGIEDTLVLLAHKVKDVRVVREFATDLPTIPALGTELNQVWTNLVDNACDALAEVDDGVLTLRARSEGDELVVEVEDNGPGIAPDVQDRIFDAFFTTKPPGHGTGLGLQISYRIVVLEHRGDLTVASKPGRTTFTVRLPTVAAARVGTTAAGGDPSGRPAG